MWNMEALPSRELQNFLQRPPERHPLLRLAIRDHTSAPLCTQLDAWSLHPDNLQTCLSDVPAKVHFHLYQTVPMSHHAFQASISDADTVLQVEAAQLRTALQHGDHVLISDVSTARQGQREQVRAPVGQKVNNSINMGIFTHFSHVLFGVLSLFIDIGF